MGSQHKFLKVCVCVCVCVCVLCVCVCVCVEGGGHNKVTFGASCNFIGKMGGWKLGGGVQILSIERSVLWNKMTL